MIATPSNLSIGAVIRGWALRTPDAEAIAAPGRRALTYAALNDEVERIGRILRALGVERSDRVAIAMSQSPEYGVAALAVASTAVALPLNITARREDCDALFAKAEPRLLLAERGLDCAAFEAARAVGIPIVEVIPVAASPAGILEFARLDAAAGGSLAPALSAATDLAMFLQTSGTTARPKIVPLTHANLCSAADNTRIALGLTNADRCLDVMPLFHGHGLIAGLLASVMGGACTVCTPKFDVTQFFEWMDACRPTWYTAVPAIHQAILQHAKRNKAVIDRSRLRFIRSASAYLPDVVRRDLEALFGVLVSESYGLSEALQLTNTPLTGAARKIGSLGVPHSSEVAIVDEAGFELPTGTIGEIVARGPNVMSGYLNDAAANQDVFRDGWFRSGDLGYVDSDGHLFLTGRLKNEINRGGEKVSPEEIDRVLLGHPAVLQAVAFGVPHPTLGEDVVVAVILKAEASVSVGELRQFTSERLAAHKAPRQVYIVSEIPCNSTGKPLRRELAAMVKALRVVEPSIAPATPFERQLLRIWEEVLGRRPIQPTDDFFELGGDSLRAADLIAAIEIACGRELDPAVLFSAPTVRQLAQRLAVAVEADPFQRPLMEIQRGTDPGGFVLLTGVYEGIAVYARNLARQLDPRHSLYALRPHAIEHPGVPSTVEEMARDFIRVMRERLPTGPYLLGGYSAAALIAFEMARQLRQAGQTVNLLFLIDLPAPDPRVRILDMMVKFCCRVAGLSEDRRVASFIRWRNRIRAVAQPWETRTRTFQSVAAKGPAAVLRHYTRRVLGPRPSQVADSESYIAPVGSVQAVRGRAYSAAVDAYVPGFYDGRITLIAARQGYGARVGDATLGWRRLASEVEVHTVSGGHLSTVTEHVDEIAAHLRDCMAATTARPDVPRSPADTPVPPPVGRRVPAVAI